MTDQPYTPHADSIQTAWVLMCQQSRVSTQPPVEELEAEFDRFLARVKRDAAREELLDLAEDYRLRAEEALSDEDFNLASTLTGHFLTIRERALDHYPEQED